MSAAEQGPFVFVHGSGDTARCWDNVIALLDLEPRRALALDLPGHGARAGDSMSGLDSVSAYGRAVLGAMDAAGIEDATFVGHSLGSAIALRLALDAPARVRRVALIGGGSRLRVLPALLEQARTHPDEALRDVTVLGHAPDHESLALAYLAAGGPRAAEALYRDLRACDAFDVTDRLTEVSQLALVLVGTEDRLTPPKYARFLADRLPHATLDIVPGAGHYVMHEAPERVATAIREWLAR